ncbi:MAG: phosphoketolase family protein [Actinoplanes sp.]
MDTLAEPVTTAAPYTNHDRELDLRWWAAANYLTVAQIYLQGNPLGRDPLNVGDIKPRLLGHWGTSPGLSMIYTLLNRLIRDTGSDVIYVAGPGHGGPALLANVYLEGTYSEIYPNIDEGLDGLTALVRQFSTPGGVPSHVSVQMPGSIHEGGELGYALAHAAGAAFDHPDLTVACVVGDGEAETRPLAASWKIPAFLNARRDGAVLPILHLNGYKISGPTVLGRATDADVIALLAAQGWDPVVVAGDDPATVFTDLNRALSAAHARTRAIQLRARAGDAPAAGSVRWPAIILRTPKGWTGPDVVDGVRIEGTFRAHQVPLSKVRENPAHLRLLEQWLHSYAPETLFDAAGRLVPELAALAPTGDKRMSASPYANGGRLVKDLAVPSLERYALPVKAPGAESHENTQPLGELLRDIYAATTRAHDGGLRSRDHVNLIVVDKQPHLQYLTLDEANAHCAADASVWDWAGTETDSPEHHDEPDVILAAAGDTPTLETLAAAKLLRDWVPYLRVRVVNVVDLMALLPADDHPHGFSDQQFEAMFTTDTDVVFAFHGYPRAIHELLHGRVYPGRFHVRGFNEQGTTTTPFDMVVLNRMSRYHLVLEALRRSRRVPEKGLDLARHCQQMLERHHDYIRENFEDLPEVRDWTWTS